MKLPILLSLLLTTLPAPTQRAPLIGIFEPASSGKPDNRGVPGVRVLFYQSGSQWRSFNADCQNDACLKTITHLFPPTTRWTLIQSGKPAAHVTADTPPAFTFYAEIGVQAITNPTSVSGLEPRPKPGEPAPAPTILATTLPTLADPDNWRPAPVFPLDLTHVRRTFRTLFPHPRNCAQNSSNSPSNYRSWNYQDTDIQLNSSWISNKNWRLLQVTLGPYRCDGPPDADFVDHWFAISPTGQVHHIGRLMHLVGAADFAHQGRSELLFSNLDDNHGGYKLWYDNFTHNAEALVTFH